MPHSCDNPSVAGVAPQRSKIPQTTSRNSSSNRWPERCQSGQPLWDHAQHRSTDMKTQLGDPQTGEGKHPPGGYTIGKDDFSHPPPDRYSPTTRKRNTTMSLQDGISHLQWRGRSTVLANMPLSLLRRATYI